MGLDTSAARGARIRAWRLGAAVLYGTGALAVGFQIVAHPAIGAGKPTGGALVTFLAFDLFSLVALIFAGWASSARGLDRRSRLAWSLVALSNLMLLASSVGRGVWSGAADVFPNPADVLRLGFAPVLLCGLLLMPLRGQSAKDRHKAWLDAGVVAVAGSMALWYAEVGPSVAAHIPARALAASIAYPTTDLMLIFGTAFVLLRGAARSSRRPLMLLCTATVVLLIGDIELGYRQSHPLTSSGPMSWPFVCWIAGTVLLAAAPFEQRRLATHQLVDEHHAVRSFSLLPYLAIAAAYGLLLFALRGQNMFPLGGLVIGSVVLTGVVVGRQIVWLRENHVLVVTDVLTGLVNRRRLYDALRLALGRGSRNRRGVAAVLIDLDGFKQVNDSLGHEAGDGLLIAFGQLLERSVLGVDVVGRLGGDEFAIVLHDIDEPDEALAVARRIAAEMEQPVMLGDTAVRPRASIGIALCAPGELTADELLSRADAAMYRAKRDKGIGYAVYDAAFDARPTAGEPA